MKSSYYLNYIVEQIHSVVVATTDEKNLPVTCVIDMMYTDNNSIYFLTATGKNFYKRLKDKGYLALSGKNGEDTMHCVSVSIRGKVRELGRDMLPVYLKKIRICLRFTPQAKAERHLLFFRYTRVSENGLTFPKSPLSVTALPLAV
jgi:uncharacterized pyridoxamine 5'-phosphate oxidase family protein